MKRATVLLASGLLAACSGPRPPLPAGAIPPSLSDWRDAGSPARGISARWWEDLGDRSLDALVDQALRDNDDLLVAAARVREARAQFDLAASRARPTVGLSGSGAETRSVSAFGQGLDQLQGQSALTVAYEADLFGRLAAATDAQRQNLKASAFAQEATRIALIATVVAGYVSLRGLDEQLRIVTETVDARAAELSVIRRRATAGYASQLDLRQAESAYEAASRLQPATRLAITEQENALSVLAGTPPRSIERGQTLDRLVGLPLPHALPSDVLRQRPDIAEAEARLAATDRSLDAARAAFMPRVQLSATLGGVASNALANPISLFSLGGSILAPLFQGGGLRADADAAAARRDQAAFAYRKAVLTAFQQVEDSMAAVSRLWEEQRAAERQIDASRAAFMLARRRYRAGYASYLDQLDAERSLLKVELQLVELRANRLSAVVLLHRQLGGGWPGDWP